jgi:hypothetical protein
LARVGVHYGAASDRSGGAGAASSTLDQLATLIDWAPVEARLKDVYAAAKGEPAWPPLSLFKALLIAVWHDLKAESYAGALVLAHHHPAYTAGSKHGWSTAMREEIDAIFDEANVWPHAVLSAHAHNYQRFTRTRGDKQIPYLIAGNGGHGLGKLTTKKSGALRVPNEIEEAAAGADRVVLENYDDQDYGYLRIVVDASQLRIEYHPASDGSAAKTPDDIVMVDLARHRLA